MRLFRRNLHSKLIPFISFLVLFCACAEDDDDESSGSCVASVEVEAKASAYTVAADGSNTDCLPPKPDDVSNEDYQKAAQILDLYTGLYENPADGTQLTMSCTQTGYWSFPAHYNGDGHATLCVSDWEIPIIATTEESKIYQCGILQNNPDINLGSTLGCKIDEESQLAFRRELAGGGFEWSFLDIDLIWRKID